MARIIGVLAALIGLGLAGCGSLGHDPGREDPLPTDLLYGREALVVALATAAEGVAVSPGNLERLTEAIQGRLSALAHDRRVPPVLARDSDFRGDVGEIRAHIVDVYREERPRYGRYGPLIQISAVEIEVQFADWESGEPLCDWIALSEHLGPAEGVTTQDAIDVAGRQAALHVLRDLGAPE